MVTAAPPSNITTAPDGRKDRAVVIRNAIESRTQALMDVMPDGLDPRRFIRATLTAITRNPELMACTPESLIIAVFEAAEIGMVPTGSLNRAWLVPQRTNVAPKGAPKRYEVHAELRIGYQGLADLMRQSGRVTSIESRAVFGGDTFLVGYGTDPQITHVPAFGDVEPDKMTHVYAVAVLPNGQRVFEVMTRSQIDGIRARAPGSNNGPWVTDYIQMARKTVVRRLANSMPLTPQAQAAIERDDQRELAPPAAAGPSRTDAVRERLAARLGHPSQSTERLKSGPSDELEGEAAEVAAGGSADEQDEPIRDKATEAELEELGDLAFGPKG